MGLRGGKAMGMDRSGVGMRIDIVGGREKMIKAKRETDRLAQIETDCR